MGTTYQSLVHPFKSLFPIHLHVLFVSLFSISLANCPCILFAVHSFFLCSSLVFLNSLWPNVTLFVIVPLVLTATSNGSRLFLTHQPSPFSSLFTLFSHPVSPIPPFFLEPYNRVTSLLGCNFFIYCHKFRGLSVHFL